MGAKFTKMHAAALGAIMLATGGASAQDVESFYKGRKIDIIIGFSVGGGYDAYARVLARHMGEHIPGKPSLVPRNMTGAGSRIAANYVFGLAPKDGTAIGIADQSIPLEQALGDSGIKFDSREFNGIGNVIAENNIVATWHSSPVKSIEDAKRIEATMGATGYNTSAQYPTVLNQMIGTKFKVILGYPGGAEVNLAMERGEVQGRGSNSWASYKGTKPEWVRDNKIIILAQVGLKRADDLPNVPLLQDLATNPEDAAAMRLLSAPTAIGRPFFAPPGVPAERVKALRAAFDATMLDPAFLGEAKKLNLDVNPVSGEDLQKIVADIIDASPVVKKRLADVLALVEREKSK
jgi:tripartite-type tricarboxylate transporter receptor subunit TctC